MQRSALCRSRRELSNEYLLAKIGVDTAENEPLEVWGKLFNIIQSCPYPRLGHADGRALPLRREGVGAVRVPAAGGPGGEVRPRGPPAVRRVAEGPDKRSTILERELANEFS